MTKQYKRSNFSFALLALVILLCVSWLWQADTRGQQLAYSEVRQLFLQEKVEAFEIDTDGTLIMQLREKVNDSNVVRYQLYDFQLFYDDLNELVQEQYAKASLLPTTTRIRRLRTGLPCCCPMCWWRWCWPCSGTL